MYCILADFLNCLVAHTSLVKFIRGQWQRMKGNLVGDVCPITWESKKRREEQSVHYK